MDLFYYEAATPADAFEKASRDSTRWGFPEMEAFEEMASLFRAGYQPLRMGSGFMCSCQKGNFMLFEDSRRNGYQIGIAGIRGHEAETTDPVANEILAFHRARRGQAFFAKQLLDYAEHVESLEDLDRGYQLLERAQLITRTDTKVKLSDEPDSPERPAFVCK